MEYKDQAIKRRRESNIELLRIIAMFMVLVVHADFLSLDKPSPEEITIMPLNAFARFFFESASIVCVNVFVLISGWFGIRFSAKGFCKFAFTCVFLLAVVYIAVLITDFNSFFADGLKGLYHKFELNWFIKAYMCLYFLAPVLNAFVDNSERKTQQTVLIGFFAIQTYYGWFTTTAGYFASGYSPLSFIGLYLLARYIHKFSPKWSTWKPTVYLSIYAALTIAMASLYFILQKHGVIHIEILNWYNNPMVIASSLSLLLYFRILPIRRGGGKIINRCAASCFAVFLIHTNPCLLMPHFKRIVVSIYESSNGVTCLLLIFLFLLAVFFASILVDQIRKYIWTAWIAPRIR